jgi:hypothetical protein
MMWDFQRRRQPNTCEWCRTHTKSNLCNDCEYLRNLGDRLSQSLFVHEEEYMKSKDKKLLEHVYEYLSK